MILLLAVSGCSSPALGTTLSVFQKIVKLIQIIVPILLIISLALSVMKLVANPDDKKLPKKILNSIIAAVLVFFIPMFVDLVMNLLGENYSVSACWNSVRNPGQSNTYVDPYDQGKRSSFIINSDEYQKGEKKKLDGPEGSSKYSSGNMVYYVYLPPNATTNLPLLVWLHGDGASESGPRSNTIGETARKAGYPAIVVQPYSPNLGSSGNRGWYEAGHLAEVKKIVDDVCAKYQCNTKNINVGGHSRGAIGTWMMVSAYPGVFHAAAPISCCKSSGFKAQSFQGVKVWAMRGSGAGSGSGNDDIYGSCMQSSVNAIKPYAKEWKYTILPNTTHGGAGSNAVSNKEMVKFIFSD